MQITLNVNDNVAAISFTVLTIDGLDTVIKTACLDVRGADGKVIDFHNNDKIELREVQENAET